MIKVSLLLFVLLFPSSGYSFPFGGEETQCRPNSGEGNDEATCGACPYILEECAPADLGCDPMGIVACANDGGCTEPCTPVPEPSAWILFLVIGAGGIFLFLKKAKGILPLLRRET